MKKFWREKNADAYFGKAKVIVPNKEELYESIIEKFGEKLKIFKRCISNQIESISWIQ